MFVQTCLWVLFIGLRASIIQQLELSNTASVLEITIILCEVTEAKNGDLYKRYYF
jgi:hypothetical protein